MSQLKATPPSGAEPRQSSPSKAPNADHDGRDRQPGYSYRHAGGDARVRRARAEKPTRLTTLELASDRLFVPSAVMATLPVSTPTAILPPASSELHTTLTMQARFP